MQKKSQELHKFLETEQHTLKDPWFNKKCWKDISVNKVIAMKNWGLAFGSPEFT